MSDFLFVAGVVAVVTAVVVAEWLSRRYRKRINSLDEKLRETSSDIQERNSEIALRDHILGSMSEAVIVAEGKGEVVYANASAARMFGRNLLSSLPAQLSSATGEIAIHHPERRDLRYSSAPITEGRSVYVVQDVTEAKRVEAVRRDFVANASHELKTPVAAILATSETILGAASDDPEKVRDFAATLVDEAGRLSRLVQDLLDLARLERGEEITGSVAIGNLVKKETEAIRDRAARKCLTIVERVEESLVLPGSEKDLMVMVRNLLENAVGYTHSGSIEVSIEARDDNVVLEITDTGVGIPAADLSRIFERFYRVDKARSRDTGGTGLGLSIVRHVAEAHGGSVSVRSELGAGSTFTVVLPAFRSV